MLTIFILAIIGAIIAAVVGTLWYSNSTPMGTIHMRYLGFDKLSLEEQKNKIAEAKPGMPKQYLLQMILSFLTSFSVVFVVIMTVRNGVSASIAIGFVVMNWLCFVVPTIGTGLLWSTCERAIVWKKFFSDIFSNLLTLLLIALLARLFV